MARYAWESRFCGFFNNFLTPIHNFKEENYMKTKKIMAAVLASLCATAAMSTVVSADTPAGAAEEEKITEIDTTFTVDGTLEGSALLDAIFGDYEVLSTYMLMTLTSDDPFVFIYPGELGRLNKWIPIEGNDTFGLYVSGLSEELGAKDPTERVPLPANTLDNLPDTAYVTSAESAGYTTAGGGAEHWKIMTKNNKKITIKAHLTAPPMGYFTLKDKTEDPGVTDKTDNKTENPGVTDKTDNKPENPGATDKTDNDANKTTKIESKFTLKDGKLEGEALTKAIIGDSKNEWKNIEGLTFTSDKPFSVQFDVKAGAVKGDEKATKYIMGVSELKKDALPDKAYNTTWALSKDEVAAMLAGDATGKSLSIKSKDGSDIEVKVTATFKAASGTDTKNTGIALAVAPIALAGAAVIVASVAKKKK